MDVLTLARWQFAITTVYHFFFVPLTIGLSIMVAVMETIYVRTGNETYKRMTKFWGQLFLINFAMGIVTGIVQEFQFGMDWSSYSRFVGDIFGAPLAVEALLAFYLESTFLGLWLFGWEKLNKYVHLATIWLVAIGSTLSAFWILVANSFMQEPVGYVIRNGRAEMTNFFALLTNPNLLLQFPHVFFAGVATAGFFVLAISAYHLLRQKKNDERDPFRRSFQMAIAFALVGSFLVALVGHVQGQQLVQQQPMKMAAAEALWNTEDPASLSLFAIIDQKDGKDLFAVRVPVLLSVLSYDRPTGKVEGINDLQKQYVAKYGPGNYVPPVAISFWSFRLMVGAGVLMILLALYGLLLMMRGVVEYRPRYLKLLLPAALLPYVANAAGWILTEVGRQPWIVFGVLKTQSGVSPNVGAGAVLFSLVSFGLIYGILMAADVFLLVKFAKAGMAGGEESVEAVGTSTGKPQEDLGGLL